MLQKDTHKLFALLGAIVVLAVAVVFLARPRVGPERPPTTTASVTPPATRTPARPADPGLLDPEITPSPAPAPTGALGPAPAPIEPSLHSLCRHRVRLVHPGGKLERGAALALHVDGLVITTAGDMRQNASFLLGTSVGAPNVSELRAEIAGAWPPRVPETGYIEVLLGENAKARLEARTPDGLLGSVLLMRCEAGVQNIDLKPVMQLSGTVMDRDTRGPMAGVTLRLQSAGFSETAVSGADGAFSVGELPREQMFLTVDPASAPGYLPVRSPLFLSPENAGEPIEVLMAPATQVAFEVRNELSEPVADAQVTVTTEGAQAAGSALFAAGVGYAVSDTTGLASMTTSLSGQVRVNVKHADHEPLDAVMDISTGETVPVVLRSMRQVTLRFVDAETREPFLERLTVVLPKGPVASFPGRDVRTPGGAQEYRIDVEGELEVQLRETTQPLNLSAVTATMARAAEASFSSAELEAAAAAGTPLEVAIEAARDDVVLVVHDAAGQVPEKYRVEVDLRGARRERFDAEELRAEYDPQAAFETLALPIAPIFPMTVRVVGTNNFLGEATFMERAEFYEVHAARSRFAIVTLEAPGYGSDSRLGRRIEPRLTITPPGQVAVMGAGTFKGYVPLGEVRLLVEWVDVETAQNKMVEQVIFVEDRKEPLQVTVSEAPPAE